MPQVLECFACVLLHGQTFCSAVGWQKLPLPCTSAYGQVVFMCLVTVCKSQQSVALGLNWMHQLVN